MRWVGLGVIAIVLAWAHADDVMRTIRSTQVAIALPDPIAIADRPPIAVAALGHATLSLHRDDDGNGALWLTRADRPPQRVPCDRLVGAWGLWVDDVDRDGHLEALVALRKPARFDPQIDNRLHVYGFDRERCVPMWRGTRLAGRFDALRTDPSDPGTIVVSERLSQERRRVARYRWNGFGYRIAEILWQGGDAIPLALARDLVRAPSESS